MKQRCFGDILVTTGEQAYESSFFFFGATYRQEITRGGVSEDGKTVKIRWGVLIDTEHMLRCVKNKSAGTSCFLCRQNTP